MGGPGQAPGCRHRYDVPFVCHPGLRRPDAHASQRHPADAAKISAALIGTRDPGWFGLQTRLPARLLQRRPGARIAPPSAVSLTQPSGRFREIRQGEYLPIAYPSGRA